MPEWITEDGKTLATRDELLEQLRAEQETLRRHPIVQPVCTTCQRLEDLTASITTLETTRQDPS